MLGRQENFSVNVQKVIDARTNVFMNEICDSL